MTRRPANQFGSGEVSIVGLVRSKLRHRWGALVVTICLAAAGFCLPEAAGAGKKGGSGGGGGGTPPPPPAPPPPLVITITATPDPAASRGRVLFEVSVKNDATIRARNVIVTIQMPESVEFVSCSTSARSACEERGSVITTNVGSIRAHRSAKVSVKTRMPAVSDVTPLTIMADANGEDVPADNGSETITVLPPSAPVVFLPSARADVVRCGDTVDAAWYRSDHTAQLQHGLGCATTEVGIRMAATGKTFDLNGKKIVGETNAGNVGLAVAFGATNVTIDGGGTSSTKGIEHFDWCVKDEGDNSGLLITDLRCYRARSAAIDLVSGEVVVNNTKIDLTAGTAGATEAPPGGIGIHARGDNVRISDTIVRRSQTIGILADGTDADGDRHVVTIEGNLEKSRVEDGAGIGVLLATSYHLLKDTYVSGDGPTGRSTDGVVVAADTVGNVIDGAVVKQFAGNGYLILGTGTRVLRSAVEDVGLDGFVIVGPGTYLKNNDALPIRHGYVVDALATGTFMDTNAATAGGDGFVVNAASEVRMEGNGAAGNGGRGFVINGSATLNTNEAEANLGDGFVVAGDGSLVENSSSNLNGGIGFNVTGRRNVFRTDKAEKNAGPEWAIGRENQDGQNNAANGTRISFSAAGGTFE